MAPEQCEKCEVFSDIYVNNWAKLLRYAKANRNSAGVAEELVQDTFHDAWSKFDELVSHENIGGWLMQTLKNKIWNYTRAKQREANMIIGHGGKTEDIAATDNFVNELFARNALSAIHRFVHDTFNEDDMSLVRFGKSGEDISFLPSSKALRAKCCSQAPYTLFY